MRKKSEKKGGLSQGGLSLRDSLSWPLTNLSGINCPGAAVGQQRGRAVRH